MTSPKFDFLGGSLKTNGKKFYILSKSRLEGKISISGAKNSVLRLLAASLLTNEKIQIDNYPQEILDAHIHVQMLETLGKVCIAENETITIQEYDPIATKLKWEARSIRNTLLILGALVARFGEGMVPLPGGCQLGDRKYDLHEMLLTAFGAEVWTEKGYLCAAAPKGLKGAEIHLPIRSTGATENAIICGTLARGITRVWNPHIRPEIIDLIGFLKKMGAKIQVFGQEHIEIVGSESLSGAVYSAIPDSMEAITWFVASVITKGDIEIIGFPYQDLEVPLIFLRESGAKFYRGENSLIVRGGKPYPIDISTGPYPGINSDMQPIFAVYGMCAKGESRIIDLRFPGRYGYADELTKMGAQYSIEDNLLKIQGGRQLYGAKTRALDLRAGIALVLAGMTAENETFIEDAWQIDRGYHRLAEKITGLGGKIQAYEK
jgi:UDP-N-acetylglucosamine 1-carboxyvinyltransferase